MPGLDNDEFGSRGKKSPGSGYDVFLPGRDEQNNGRILQMVGREDETTMAEVPIVIDSNLSQTALHQLSFQIGSHRTPPASLKCNIAMDSLEIFRSQGCAVIEA